MEGQMLAPAKQLQTAPPSLPHWKSPPRIGYLYDGKVIAKKNEYLVFETESNDLGIVEAFHFDDDASISCQIFSELEVGQRIKTIFFSKKT